MTVPDPDKKAIIRAPSREVSIARGNMASRALAMVNNALATQQVLTKEIAESYLADENSVDLLEFSAIEDSAAESLSRHKKGLVLDGLTSLSDSPGHVALARKLAQYKFQTVSKPTSSIP